MVVMVDSQSCSSSNQARVLDAGDEEEEKEEEEGGAPKLVSTCWGRPEANSYPESNICTPKNRTLEVSPAAWSGEGGPF